MAADQLSKVIRHLRTILEKQEVTRCPDTDLLERYVRHHDEVAFEALVRRHGPLVFGACRRILRNHADAEDAFQATFLVLVRKASSLRSPEMLASWLYAIACRTALEARRAAAIRRVKEASLPARTEAQEDAHADLRALLDQELERLPAKYRAAVVVCDLQGKTRKESARQLGWPEGTVAGRLARGRSMLARRLARHGVVLSAVAIAGALAETASADFMPPMLVALTVKAAALKAGISTAAGSTIAGSFASAKAIKLSETVIKMMLLSKVKVVLSALALTFVVGFSVQGVISHRLGAAAEGPAAGGPTKLVALVGEEQEGKALLQKAIEAATAVVDDETRVAILLQIGYAQLRLGERTEALATAAKALAIVKTLDAKLRKVTVQLEIASLQDEAGDKKARRATIESAEQTALTLLEPFEKGNGLLKVVGWQTLFAEYEEALRVAAESGEYQGGALGMSLAHTITLSIKKNGNVAAAREALQKAVAIAKTLDSGRASQTLGNIAEAQARIGQLQDAMQTVEAIAPFEKNPAGQGIGKLNALRGIARAQAGTGDWQGALKTYAGLTTYGGNYDILADIATAQIKAGKRPEALKTIEELWRMASETEKEKKKAQEDLPAKINGKIVILEAKLGNLDAALKTVATLKSSFEKAQAYLAIGKAQTELGKKAEARKTLRRAAGAAAAVLSYPAGSLGRNSPNARSGSPVEVPEYRKFNLLSQIAVAQARAGDSEEAAVTLEDITSDEYSGLYLVLQAMAEAGDFENARQMLPKIKKMAERGYALDDLTRLMTKAGQEKSALALATQQTSPALKAFALLGILAGKTAEQVDKK